MNRPKAAEELAHYLVQQDNWDCTRPGIAALIVSLYVPKGLRYFNKFDISLS